MFMTVFRWNALGLFNMENELENYNIDQSLIISRIIRIEAMLETSISMQAQILANLEGKEKKVIQDNASNLTKETTLVIMDFLKNYPYK
ncbi:hypothetical protein SAMN04488101_11336 [Pedobacter nyackensis]|uniref:Uncharacterized protein n=2 Tax=Pedobacter nyackensis TaxID=475255 RepID=A0A1W2ELU7_9SPHI|nr:hypothetical protein SAMN04488101_11336 [Pedobacter nyackensis]